MVNPARDSTKLKINVVVLVKKRGNLSLLVFIQVQRPWRLLGKITKHLHPLKQLDLPTYKMDLVYYYGKKNSKPLSIIFGQERLAFLLFS